MDDVFYGTIKLDDGIHFFNFSNKVLFIHPIKRTTKYVENIFSRDIINEKKLPYLVGVTYDEHLIYFVDLKLVKCCGNEYYGYPQAFIIFNDNLLIWDYNIFNISKIVLESSAINSLQSKDYEVKLTQFLIEDEKLDKPVITSNFQIKNGDCTLKTGYNINYSNVNPIIQIKSSFDISLNNNLSCYEVYNLVNKINEVFKFIYNRENVGYSSIKLITEKISCTDELTKKDTTRNLNAKMKFLYHKDESMERNMTIGKNAILRNFQKMIDLIDKEIISYYPKDDKEFRYVDSNYFIKVCGTFEREFCLCFKESNCDKESKYEIVKNKLVEFLDELDKEYYRKDKEMRKKISTFKNTINKMDERLERRLNYAYNHFSYCLQPRFNDYCRQRHIEDHEFTRIASSFADKRNKVVHTFEYLGLSSEEIVGFLITRELIYCMMLQQAGFTNEEIKAMISLYQ